MGKKYSEIPQECISFIEKQRIFFVATAMAEGRVNISPKGMDSLRILSTNKVAWLNVTGSGNETATHLLTNSRMTIMFAAFTGSPMILRLYGHAKALHGKDQGWTDMISLFPPLPGARQIIVFDIDLVQTSCGMSVPFYDYKGEREELNIWARQKGEEGIKQYWEKTNQHSLDGVPSGIIERSVD